MVPNIPVSMPIMPPACASDAEAGGLGGGGAKEAMVQRSILGA